jgi:hypothetical protein
MGSYTDPEKFYLIDPNELVSVDSDINYNLLRADTRLKALAEYQVTDVTSISNSEILLERGFKYYKTYSNSIWNYHALPDNSENLFQDPNSPVESWRVDFGSFVSGYGSQDQGTNKIAYSIMDGWVHFRGHLVFNNGTSELPANSGYNFINLSENLIPEANRFFMLSGGRAIPGGIQIFRVVAAGSSDGGSKLSFTKYGNNAIDAANRYLSLNGLRYPLASKA